MFCRQYFIGVLVCYLLISVSAGTNVGKTTVYRGEVSWTVNLCPDSTQSDLYLTYDAFIKPIDDSSIKQVFIKNLDFSFIVDDLEIISSETCDVIAKFIKELELPFLASFENGTFKYIRVSNDDSSGSEMIKMILTTFLQANMTKFSKVNSEKSSYDSNEYNWLGNIHEHFDVLKREVPNGSVFRIKKTVDLSSSDKFNYGPVTIQDGSCNSLSNAEFEYHHIQKQLVYNTSLMTGIISTSLDERANYKPWKNCDKTISVVKTVTLKTLPSIQTSLSVDLNEENSRKVTKFTNRTPNAAFTNVTGNDGLVGIYRALDCSGEILRGMLYYYELILQCPLKKN